MKRIINTVLVLFVAIMMTAQNSFVLTDKNGNSQLVQSLIFQHDANSHQFSWKTVGDADGYQADRDIRNLQFIARVKNELMMGTVDEVTNALEEISGTDNADAAAVAAALQSNPNVEEAYSVDGDNVIVKIAGDDCYAACPLYNLNSVFSDGDVVFNLQNTTNNIIRRAGRPVSDYEKVAIFNFFEGGPYNTKQIFAEFLKEIFKNNLYRVEYYGQGYENGGAPTFTMSKLDDVISHSSEYMAIIIMSHGYKTEDGNTYFATCERYQKDKTYPDKQSIIIDGNRFVAHSSKMGLHPKCLLYLGPCHAIPEYGYGFPQTSVIGWQGKNAISQIHASVFFHKILYSSAWIGAEEALNSSFQKDPFNPSTPLYVTNNVYDWDFAFYSGVQKDYAESILVELGDGKDKFIKKTGNTMRFSTTGYVKGNAAEHWEYAKIEVEPVVRIQNQGEYSFKTPEIQYVELSNAVGGADYTFETLIPFDRNVPEGIYRINVYVKQRRGWKLMIQPSPVYVVYSTKLDDNYVLPEASDADIYTPKILDSNGQLAEEITVASGSSKKFAIDGYSGHTFKTATLNNDIASVSVDGSTLTVTGVSGGETYIGVMDEQNKQMVVAKVIVEESSQFEGQIVLERRYMVDSHGDVSTSWEGKTSDNYAYQSLRLLFDNDRSIQIGYLNAYYWDDSRTTKRQGVYIISYQGNNKIKEWYIEPRRNNTWIKEKIVIEKTGKVRYYSDDNSMGEEIFSELELENAKNVVVDVDPYGWWYTHYHHMDDFKLTTPAKVISDNFDDGIINTDIWQQPMNPDGVREEDGIMKTEQLRTDKDFHLRSQPIDLTGNGSTDLSTGLVAYYPFNGNTNDESGHGNNVESLSGDITSTVGVAGNQDGAYHFNGGRMFVPNSESLKFDKTCTFSAYIKPTEYTSSDGYSCSCVVGKSFDQVGATMLEYDTWKDSLTTNIGVHGNNITNNYIDQNRQRIGVKGNYLNKWVHIANVIDGDRALYYINGKLIWEHAITTPEFFNTVNQQDMYIGKNGANWYGMRGDLDEVRIYNRALSASEIEQLAVYGEEPTTTAFTSCPDNNHPHMIDLGLPSGTKWACCNVGASKPEDYGNYYAWGETQPKDYYDWETYIHCDGSKETCHNIGSDIAGTQYDAATTNWGAPWRMPTVEQYNELIENCNSEWTYLNNEAGRKFIGSNGGTIFLPAAGSRWGTKLSWTYTHGHYWSSNICDTDYSTSNGLYTGDKYWGQEILYCDTEQRYVGRSIRPVSK